MMWWLQPVMQSSLPPTIHMSISPADTVTTGYVIYYQPKTGGPVISESVTGGHKESHSLTGLQRGHTYNISIVALSQHLPSPLVGPVNVAGGEPLNACSPFYTRSPLSYWASLAPWWAISPVGVIQFPVLGLQQWLLSVKHLRAMFLCNISR